MENQMVGKEEQHSPSGFESKASIADESNLVESSLKECQQTTPGKEHRISDYPPCNYIIEKTLGKGVFGEVFEARAPDDHRVALKRLSKNGAKFAWPLVNREVETVKRLKGHSGIAQLESYFETVTSVYLVFELVDGVDLFTFMEQRDFHPMMEKKTKGLIQQIVDSLLFCHSKRVSHRDIKLDNIILDSQGHTKLVDFGLAALDEEGDKGCKNYVGSPEYVAPEVIQRIPYSGYKADVYSLGMVLYCLLFGQFPFVPELRFETIANGEPHPLLDWPDKHPRFPAFVSAAAKDLLSKMLEVNPDVRLSMQEVANHRWLQGINDQQQKPHNPFSIDLVHDESGVC